MATTGIHPAASATAPNLVESPETVPVLCPGRPDGEPETVPVGAACNQCHHDDAYYRHAVKRGKHDGPREGPGQEQVRMG